MLEWWSELDALAQILFGSAVFFTVLLVLQLVSLFGADADDGDHADADDGGDADGHAGDGDADADHSDADHPSDPRHHGSARDDDLSDHVAHGSTAAALWRGLASRRSVVSFLTLFSWAGALYLQAGRGAPFALGAGAAWGLLGSVLVAAVYLGIRHLQSPGERFALGEVVGEEGTVYLRIPPDGRGQVRVRVAGRWQVVHARTAGGAALRENTPVFVTRALDDRTVEVIPAAAVLPPGDALSTTAMGTGTGTGTGTEDTEDTEDTGDTERTGHR
jgi:hypothetical protein